MKTLICLLLSIGLLAACATKNDTVQQPSSGIVPKPKSSERKPGEKMNMMILMETEDISDEMDEVIVIPPKTPKKQEAETQ